MHGGGYLISRKLSEFLEETQRKYGLTQAISEDVSLGLWLFALNVTKIDWRKMMLYDLPKVGGARYDDKKLQIDICEKKLLIIHRVSEQKMMEFYNQLQECTE
eukprot:TRINITY_DN28484_c0_g1_i1.p2 TRINITY_DN28484_c0_g1~~TRINITY_DN28484_c0_g1_i1.p2  ORF type:complete len:103 (+),score=8.74 TRINITY_DN28484_c0_g1_i1:1-309(+)